MPKLFDVLNALVRNVRRQNPLSGALNVFIKRPSTIGSRIEALLPEQREMIGEKGSRRSVQCPGSYFDGKYVRAMITQSLIVTCRPHSGELYIYPVDALQRIDRQPATRIAEFKPHLWKRHCGAGSLRSDLHDIRTQGGTAAAYRLLFDCPSSISTRTHDWRLA